jgi:hypothetical protein
MSYSLKIYRILVTTFLTQAVCNSKSLYPLTRKRKNVKIFRMFLMQIFFTPLGFPPDTTLEFRRYDFSTAKTSLLRKNFVKLYAKVGPFFETA